MLKNPKQKPFGKNKKLFLRPVVPLTHHTEVLTPVVLGVPVLMIYVLAFEVVASFLELSTGLITATTVLSLLLFGVVVVVFLTVVASHLRASQELYLL